MHPKTILFLGTHGQYNIGDELLLETFLSQLGPEHHYLINSYDPGFTTLQLADRYHAQPFHTVQEKSHLPKLIFQSDLVFFGGGGILKELYASVGRNRYATLFMILAIVTFANLIARKPIIMSNIGIGPVNTPFGMFLARLILRQVQYVSVRDQKSYDNCLRLNILPPKAELVADAVFVHDPAFFVPRPQPQVKDTPLKIALNLNYDIENPESWERFLAQLARGLTLVHQQRPLEIHALPMQAGFKAHTDLELLNEFSTRLPDIPMFAHEPATPQDIGQIIAECDIIVAERLHTCITAAVIGKPFLPLIYDVKVREMAKMLEMEDFGLEIDALFNAEEFAETLLGLDIQQSEVKKLLHERGAALRLKLRDYFRRLNETIERIETQPARPTPAVSATEGTSRAH
ncbi:MAG TPA: polysaccharide pyruvyl transferase family protein [Anaerolineales bacterium]|nr:polysaccharide pyruvyl transferase family protein [Anaerolineales bacterium]